MSVFRTMPVDHALRRSERSDLRRKLTGLDIAGFGIGIIIGTGIFVLAGQQAKANAGASITLSFVVGAIVAGLAALCYAEMAASVPTAGSAYTYAFATLGEVVGWVIGWDLLLEFGLGLATVSRSWSSYLANLFGLPQTLFGEEAPVNIGAIAIIAILTVVAISGIRESSTFTNVLVLVKLAVVVLVIGAGLFFVKASNLSPFIPPAQQPEGGGGLWSQPVVSAAFGLEPTIYGVGGMLAAAAIVFFAYTGFEALANLGEETANPGKDLKVGILGALGVCAALYVIVSLIITAMVRYDQLDEGAPLATAFDQVGQGWIGSIIAVGAVTGLTSVMMVELVTIGRIGFAMSRDGLLPKAFSRVHPKRGTPYVMTVTGAVVIALIAGFTPISELASMVSIGALSAMVVVCVAVPILRRTRPELKRPFRVPGSPVLPILGALACLYLMLNLDLLSWARFAVWLVIGLVIYFVYGRRHSFLARDEQP